MLKKWKYQIGLRLSHRRHPMPEDTGTTKVLGGRESKSQELHPERSCPSTD